MSEHTQYAKNFIDRVVFRLDLSPVLAISKEVPTKFQEKIKDKFPVTDLGALLEIETIITGTGRTDKQNSIPLYTFRTADSSKKVIISQNNFSIEVSKYTEFEEFKTDVLNSYNYFQGIYSPLTITRCGLRYINKIKIPEGNPLDWNDYINPSLLSFIGSFPDNLGNISRAMSQLCFNKDSFNIHFNYGIFNPEFPGKVSRKEFILDYDCFTRECTQEGVETLLKNSSTEIQKMFEQSVTPGLRDLLGKKI